MLDEAWTAVAGSSGTRPADLRVSGPDGLLPSRFPVLETAVACAGTALLAAAALGGHETVELDREHVADAFRSERFVRVDGQPLGDGFAPLSRFWPAADGWVRTHANYPWHRDALLDVLGVSPDGAGLAIAERNAAELEDAVLAAGGIAVAVRDERTWRQTEQARLLAARPLVTSERIGSAPPRPRRPGEGARPASDIRVLDLTRVIAGPTGTRFLGALGADVLRVDPPHRPELPLHQVDGLLGKRSALLDATTPDGLRTLHELLDQADVLVHGYRAHALDRFGLTAHALAERHPGLVVVSLSAWGDDGPWGDRRGFDSIVQAASGIALVESADGTTPSALPCQLLDHGTGYLCAAAALTALAAQTREGGTHFRSLALARTALWLLDQPRCGVEGHAPAREPTRLSTMDSADGPVTMVDPLGTLDGVSLTWPPKLASYGAARAQWSGDGTRGRAS
jgi:hypothetical protein